MKIDRISGIVLSLVGAAGVLAVLRSYPLGTLKEPGAGFFPLLGAALLLGLSLLLTFQRVRQQAGQESSFSPGKNAIKRIVFALIAVLAYRYLLPVIGFTAVTGLFIFVLAKFMGSFSWAKSVVIALITALVSYYLFQVVLKVPMPAPMIGF